MIHFKSFSSFYSFIENLKKDDVQFKIIGHSLESFVGAYSCEKPDNNRWTIKLVTMSSIGSFYLSESLNMKDTEKIADIKSKLAKLSIIDGDVSQNDSVISIK